MASVTKDARASRDGWRVRFYTGERQRELYFRGRKRDAEDFGRKCEALAKLAEAGLSPDPELVSWLRRLDAGKRESLVRWGLCEPASPKLQTDQGRLLGPFLRDYISGRKDIAHNTRKNLNQAMRVLIDHFGERHALRSIKPGDAARWQRWLMAEQGLAIATTSMHTKKAKLMFKAAVDDGLIESNPFDAIKGMKESNVERQRFIPREVIDRILDACPGPQWRLVVVLCRYAGLRCPSEVLGLRWDDIDWDRGSLRVDSPKTGLRFVPMFPGVRKALEEAYESADDGAVRCVDEYAVTTTNLRTQFQRIIERAGIEAWPRLFHNLRASCRTELQEALPEHAINKWLGQSSRVAEEHYVTVHDEHWERALNMPSNLSLTGPLMAGTTDPIGVPQESEKTNDLKGVEGVRNATRYPRRESNNQGKPQGKPHEGKNCPLPVPLLVSESDSEATELLTLWPVLDGPSRAKVLELARSLSQQPIGG